MVLLITDKKNLCMFPNIKSRETQNGVEHSEAGTTKLMVADSSREATTETKQKKKVSEK